MSPLEDHDDPVPHPGHEPRALDARPRLRLAASLIWSAFLGGSLGLVGLLLMPESWLDLPVKFERLAVSFACLFLLALVSATIQAILSHPPPDQAAPSSHPASHGVDSNAR